MTDETNRLFGAAQFAAMKESAVFVNIGRGLTVDQSALIEALEAKQLSAAALDVFEEEPLPSDSPLWTMDNVSLSPHVGGTGGHMYQLFAELVAQPRPLQGGG